MCSLAKPHCERGDAMRKIKITYDSPLDALVAVSKRLSVYEEKYRMDSETFFDRYDKGETSDTVDFVEWANDYRHYMALKIELDIRLVDAA